MWSEAWNLLASPAVERRTRELVEAAKRLRSLTYFTRCKAMHLAARAHVLCREAIALRSAEAARQSDAQEAWRGRYPA